MCDIGIADCWDFCQSLECQVLDFLVVDAQTCEDSVHNDVALFFDCEVLGSGRDNPQKSGHCGLTYFRVLTINVPYCAIKDLLNFSWL